MMQNIKYNYITLSLLIGPVEIEVEIASQVLSAVRDTILSYNF